MADGAGALTDEELLGAVAMGDGDAQLELTARYQPLIIATAARLHRRRDHEHDDVLSCGQIGLQKAIRDFDGSRGMHFAAYAKAKVRGEMMRWFRDARYDAHVPRPLHELAMRVRRVERDLESKGVRTPTVDDIASHLDTTPTSVIEALAVGRAERLRSAQLDSWMQRTFVGHRHPELGAAFESLPIRARYVLHKRHIDRLSQAEIGVLLGVTQAHVSRIEAAAVTHLQAELGDRPSFSKAG